MDRAQVERLITQHPGGYADILNTLERKGDLPIAYKTKVMVEDDRDRMKEETQIKYVSAADLLAEINMAVDSIKASNYSGNVARAIQNVLAKYGLPLPGDKAWGQPAEMWLVEKK